MKERDCANCKHHTSDGCSSWDCEFEAKDLINRADAIMAVWTSATRDSATEKIEALPSAELPKGELISRADAIERIVNDNVVGGMDRVNEYRNSNEHNDYLDGISCAIATVDDVPSAEAEWIPCSERLPEEEEETYWVCTDTEYQCECRWTNNRFGLGEGEWGWSIFDTPQYSKPIAWMPLPKPYREDGEI